MTAEWTRLFRSIVPAGAFGAAAFTLTSQSAEGFFPPVPTTPPKVIIVDVPPTPPVVVPPTVIPPVPPPPFVPVPPTVPPTIPPVPPPCNCPPVPVDPQVVPEPAALTAGLIGLGAVAAWRRVKRKA